MHALSVWWEWCIDFIFPKTLRAERCETYQELPFAPKIRLEDTHAVTSLLSYTHQSVRDAIQAAKFDADTRARTLLAAALDTYLIEKALTHSEEHRERLVVIPIPLGTLREAERGYNQVTEILNHTRAVQEGFVELCTDALQRARETEKQALLDKKARLTNVRGAFQSRNIVPITKRDIILLDDVVTTGSTLAAAAQALRPHANSVALLAIARAA